MSPENKTPDLSPTPEKIWESRAVLRAVEAGNVAECALCGQKITFMAQKKLMQVICNVYVDGKWDRVDYYEPDCYERLGQPYGAPDTTPAPLRQRGYSSNVSRALLGDA